ncbi:MAG: L-2-hydroxyglutarate oxidase [Verrucomicrobia bacterium]|nr:L-2-hydroxyglutarate oxidase [Verrucomicrobiota bacterium]
MKVDYCVIGGGIVGLATAFRLSRNFPDQSIVVVEKEEKLAEHQTGRNSGVLHSGIYYKPGSLKAKNCRLGKLAMERFCAEHGIDYELCGKVIVATQEDERDRLKGIYQRGQSNGVNCELIPKEKLREIEPHAAGIEAIHVPECGIVNYRQVCERLGDLLTQEGRHQILLGQKVVGIEKGSNEIVVQTTNQRIQCQKLINCAGLHSDRITQLGGQKPDAKIIPFKGEYYFLSKEAEKFCNHLIYPVPDPKFPFLGVHFTRMIEGGVECGPNAVLAFGREAYEKFEFSAKDFTESVTYPGFQIMALKHWKMGWGEMWRSFSKQAFVKALQRLVPAIEAEHLSTAPAGIRAQAVAKTGGLVDDFLIQKNGSIINVCNAPSPAATASLNIAEEIIQNF